MPRRQARIFKSSKPLSKNQEILEENDLRSAKLVVTNKEVAAVSLKKIEETLDDPKAEVCAGVYVAPVFKGHWGACAQVQIEAAAIYGPHINTAESLICRVFASSPEGLYVTVDQKKYTVLQDGCFRIPRNAIYSLQNPSEQYPVALYIQVFEAT